MPNNSSDNLDDQEVYADPFTAFLEFLCPEDPDEANRRYLRIHAKLAGYFRWRGMADPLGDADEVIKRAGKKILKRVPIPDIDRFCLGIARNVVQERLRNRQNEESAFKQFLENCQTDQTDVEKIMSLMERCFEKLPAKDRELLIDYCTIPEGLSRAEHRRQLAEKRNTTIQTLRIRITRLRRKLDDCVKGGSKNL